MTFTYFFNASYKLINKVNIVNATVHLASQINSSLSFKGLFSVKFYERIIYAKHPLSLYPNPHSSKPHTLQFETTMLETLWVL